MTDIDGYIRELFNGIMPDFYPAQYDNYNNPDWKVYQKYIPLLCTYIEKEQKGKFRYAAYMVLVRILPEVTAIETVEFLFTRLKIETDGKFTEQILLALLKVKIPAEIDLTPLKAVICTTDDFFIKQFALETIRNVEGKEGEAFLLELLKRTENPDDIINICDILKQIGTVFSLPVIMARFEPCQTKVNRSIKDTVKAIGERLMLPATVKEKLNDTRFWKVKWKGSALNFVGFMMLTESMSGNNGPQEHIDLLAEAFIEEMEVDISPYETYRELRICSSGEDWLADLEHRQNQKNLNY